MSTKSDQNEGAQTYPENGNAEEVFQPDYADSHNDDIDPWVEYLQAIKNKNFERFRELLFEHPEFSTRIEVATRHPCIFAIVQVQDEDLAIEMMKLVMEKGCDPHFKDGLKQNVMFYIARDGNLKLLEYLSSIGVDCKIADSFAQTPLYYAARDGRTETCKRLIELGCDVNHADMHHQTCLFYSAKSGHLETSKFLVECGAKHDFTDTKKQTPIFWARKSGNKELIDYLQSLKNTKKTAALSDSGSNAGKSTASAKRKKEEPKEPYRLYFMDGNGNKSEVTFAEFEAFKRENPKVAELLMNPDRLAAMDFEIQVKESWEKAAKKIIQSIWKIKGCYHFHQPVDPIKLSCFDYFDIIKNPMDFGTIKSKLNTGQYEDAQQFLDDMRLVFANCYLYNGPQTEIRRIGNAIETEFEKQCKETNIARYLNSNKETVLPDVSVNESFAEDQGRMDDASAQAFGGQGDFSTA